MEIHEKEKALKRSLAEKGRIVVAYSAGVDSTYLLKMANDVLGENVVAVTAVSKAYPVKELEEAKEFCQKHGIEQILVETKELSIPGFEKNPKDRCYICKKAIFQQFLEITEQKGIKCLVEGSNMDDEGDYRPGAKAISELGVESPLKNAGLTKAEIRELSKEAGLSTWNKPSAACLYSRFVYGEMITEEKLRRVEQAEEYLKDLGFMQLRVRVHGETARIEVAPEDILELAKPEKREKVNNYLKTLGFVYVTLDLAGYQMGSMNKVLEKDHSI